MIVYSGLGYFVFTFFAGAAELRLRHTLYYIRMEYWGPIVLVIYFGLIAFRSFR